MPYDAGDFIYEKKDVENKSGAGIGMTEQRTMLRFRKLLCPVDFFPASLKAFDYALTLAAQYGARVHALHVVAPVITAAYTATDGLPFGATDLTSELEKESRRLLQALKEKAVKAKIPIETEVRVGGTEGGIDDEILRAVEADGADLVVMGTHGRRGFKRWILGSVIDQMMRRCPVPLLVTGSTTEVLSAPPEISRILVTTDFSAGTPDALALAFSIAREGEAKVTLLHVLPDLSLELGSELKKPMVASLQEKLDNLVPSDLKAKVRAQLEVGEPYRVIQRFIEAEKPDLVVMNIHGKAMLDRLLLGSTAERVLRSASDKCLFLLIPAAKTPKQKD